MKPTLEQEAIVDAAINQDVLKVEAVAGSGKTSTLKMVTEAVRKPTVYMAFNKAMAQEASEKFPSHVTCRTVHSMAFAQVGCDYMHKLNRPKGRYKNVVGTPTEVARHFNLKGSEKLYTDIKEGFWVVRTLAKFEQSADDEIKPHHAPYNLINEHIDSVMKRLRKEGESVLPHVNMKQIISGIVDCAKKLWEERVDVMSDVLITHDTYLKLFQLSKPKLDFDVVLLDEAQDASPSIVDIVLNQRGHAKVILVGDTYQQIYQWRGAINAMEKVNAPTKSLTKSFRFGDAIANVANHVLDKPHFVKGNEKIASVLDVIDLEIPHTRLYRTNAKLIEDTVGMLGQGQDIRLEVDTRSFTKKLTSVLALYDKDMKKVKHPEIIGYESFNDFMEAVEHDPEMKRMGNMCKNGMADKVIRTLTSHKNPDVAHITLSTAHKSKGLEWDNVVLADDFRAGLGDFGMNDAERNLLYVACTRARNILELNEVALVCLMGEVNRGEYDE